MAELEKVITKLEQDMAAAFNSKDVAKFLTFFDRDMVGFSSTTHNLVEGLDALKETVEYYLGEGEKVEYSISNVKVQDFGDIAVASFHWVVNMDDGARIHEIPGRGTHVYHKVKSKMKKYIMAAGLILLVTILTACAEKQQPHEPVLPGDQTIFRDFGEPAWGPSGLIAYGHGRTTDSSGIWLMNEDGANQRPFLVSAIDGIFSRPDWSPDGQWLALGKGAQIYKITVTKDSLVQLTTDPLRKFFPSWSPDGKWIAFHINDGDYSEWGIWAVSSDGDEKRQIIQIAGLNPNWSPNGDKICFVGWPGAERKSKLLTINTQGSNLRIVFDPSKHGFKDTNDIDHPSFSPDGGKILFQVDSAEKRDAQIWVVNTDGSNPRRLTSKSGLEPSWSPDGRWLVYVRFSYYNPEQTGNGKLWIMDANGKNKRQLTF